MEKPAEPEPPTKNSPTRIHVLSIRVYEYTVIKIIYAIVPTNNYKEACKYFMMENMYHEY